MRQHHAIHHKSSLERVATKWRCGKEPWQDSAPLPTAALLARSMITRSFKPFYFLSRCRQTTR